LAVVAGMKKPNDHAEPTKVERYKFKKIKILFYHWSVYHTSVKYK